MTKDALTVVEFSERVYAMIGEKEGVTNPIELEERVSRSGVEKMYEDGFSVDGAVLTLMEELENVKREQAVQDDWEKRYAEMDVKLKRDSVEKQLTKMKDALRRALEDLERDGATLLTEMDERIAGVEKERYSGVAERAGWLVNAQMWVLPNMAPQELIAEAAKFEAAMKKAGK